MTIPMNDRDWQRLFALLDHGWPGELTADAAGAYRALLDGTDLDAIVAAVRRLLHEGRTFRPSAAEILGTARTDPSRPTWEEAFRLIFGPRGALAARRPPGIYADQRAMALADDAAVRDRLTGMHPLVGAFVERQGIERLRSLPLDERNADDPADAMWRRKELREAWDRHLEATDGREVAALAAGGDHTEGLRRLDPLSALNPPAAPELERGTATKEHA
jgi:hypothetical protein